MSDQPFDQTTINQTTRKKMTEADYPSLEAIADAIGISYGTAKDWAYKQLGLRSPFTYKDARLIASKGIYQASKARGQARKLALENQKKCSEFLGEMNHGNE